MPVTDQNPLHDMPERGLSRWLLVSGIRGRAAVPRFVFATLGATAIGLVVAILLRASGLVELMVNGALGVPGGLGEIAAPVVIAGPWILCGLLALAPWSWVRTRRRKRVEDVERELPIVLELLATMSESGVGFDGALDRVLASRERPSPLVSEFRTFQTESLAGHGRVACFRRLSARLAVPSVSIFTSALVHAERLGAGYSSVLRTQADDLRKRRRERANTAAQALPVKLVFPLIMCFLPGIFVTTLGPAALEFLRIAGQFTHE